MSVVYYHPYNSPIYLHDTPVAEVKKKSINRYQKYNKFELHYTKKALSLIKEKKSSWWQFLSDEETRIQRISHVALGLIQFLPFLFMDIVKAPMDLIVRNAFIMVQNYRYQIDYNKRFTVKLSKFVKKHYMISSVIALPLTIQVISMCYYRCEAIRGLYLSAIFEIRKIAKLFENDSSSFNYMSRLRCSKYLKFAELMKFYDVSIDKYCPDLVKKVNTCFYEDFISKLKMMDFKYDLDSKNSFFEYIGLDSCDAVNDFWSKFSDYRTQLFEVCHEIASRKFIDCKV
jgi:hypothetical protein